MEERPSRAERSDIHSVSRLVGEARALLERGFPLVWIRGEISNLAQPASGHLYFSLKDATAQVRCALFRNRRAPLGFVPANGQQVLARARVTLYEPRGDFQLAVEHLEPDGAGAARLAFEQLKRRLAAEGLFDPAAKRPLPAFPRQVGLITSPSGAAVRDLLAVLGRRFRPLRILIYPAQVQGANAPATLMAALALANARADCEVLILARGGGSQEDLGAFNDEGLARAIRASAIPVVSGVGHEIDLTLADLAADRRAPTPSAAAELVAPLAEHLHARLAADRARLLAAQRRRLSLASQRLQSLTRQLALLHPSARFKLQARRLEQAERRLILLAARRLTRARGALEVSQSRLALATPTRRLELARLELDRLRQRLLRAATERTRRAGERLARSVAGLDARSPLATLARGYALAFREADGRLVREVDQAPTGTSLRLLLAAGELRVRVE